MCNYEILIHKVVNSKLCNTLCYFTANYINTKNDNDTDFSNIDIELISAFMYNHELA